MRRLLRFRHNRSGETPVALATDLVESGQPIAALEVINRGLADDPLDPTLLLLAGRAWLVEGDLGRSQKALLQAAQLNKQDAEPFRWLGEVLLRRADLERAERVAHQALELSPNSSAVHDLLGRIASEQSQPELVWPPDENTPVVDDEPTHQVPDEVLQEAMRQQYEQDASEQALVEDSWASLQTPSKQPDEADLMAMGAPEPDERAPDISGLEERNEEAPKRPLVGLFAALAIVACLALAVVGWSRYRQYVADSANLDFAAAQLATFRGGAELVDAQRRLDKVMKASPSAVAAHLAVMGRAMVLLDEGALDSAPFTDALARHRSVLPESTSRLIVALEAWLGGDESAATQELTEQDTTNALELYLAGRLRQRLRVGDGDLFVTRALRSESTLAPAALALLEADYLSGQSEDQHSASVIAQSPQHVRARLWALVFNAEADPSVLNMALSSPADQVLLQIAKGNAAGEDEPARRAHYRKALEAGSADPRQARIVAEAARRAGDPVIALEARQTAVSAAPKSVLHRVDLARALVERYEGGRALMVLGDTPLDTAELASLHARAALIEGDPARLKKSLQALEPFDNVAAPSISARVNCALQPNRDALKVAKRLVARSPTDLDAQLALAGLRVDDRSTYVGGAGVEAVGGWHAHAGRARFVGRPSGRGAAVRRGRSVLSTGFNPKPGLRASAFRARHDRAGDAQPGRRRQNLQRAARYAGAYRWHSECSGRKRSAGAGPVAWPRCGGGQSRTRQGSSGVDARDRCNTA